MAVINMGRGDAYDVRIDRRTKLGNPSIVGRYGTREECVAQYRLHLWLRAHLHLH